MFSGDVNMCRSIVIGRITRKARNATTWTHPQPLVQRRRACWRDHASTSADERVADERPLLERRAGRSSAMRNTSATKPVTPMHEERAEDDRVLGLGLDADAVRAAARSGGTIAHTMPTRNTTPGDVADERVAPGTTPPCRNFERLGQLVVDLEHDGDDEQDEEAEVDQRVHEPGGGVAQQRLHVDAGAEVRAGAARRSCVVVRRSSGAPRS